MFITNLLPGIISFLFCILLCYLFIPVLRLFKFGQFVRENGPIHHLKKAGTPTMGGIIFLISILCVYFIFDIGSKESFLIVFAMFGFGIIGFIDDYRKIRNKKSQGLKVWQKLFGEFFITGWIVFFLNHFYDGYRNVLLPFTGNYIEGTYVDLRGWYFLFLYVVILGTVNGVNFTDGLDGLASSITVLIALFFYVISIGFRSELSFIISIVVGSLLGFLIFNTHPARIFMGDTGSLALGGFVSMTAILLRMPVFILIVGCIYFIEVLSVIIQVSYYKITGGKRFFRMAPFHHHFELGGWKETKVVTIFSVITGFSCLLVLLGM